METLKTDLIKIFNHYGVCNQLLKLEEELVEFVQALIHYKKNPTEENLEILLSEIADVLNVNSQFMLSDSKPALNRLPKYVLEMVDYYFSEIATLKKLHQKKIHIKQKEKIDRTLKIISEAQKEWL